MIQINEAQRNELEQWVHSRSLSATDVFRARLILSLADGCSYSRIIQILQTSAPTISRWKKRFEKMGIDGLDTRHKGSRTRSNAGEIRAKIISAFEYVSYEDQAKSYRKLASKLKVGKSTVQRISAQYHLRPHRLQHYMANADPAAADLVDIVGLFLDAPQHAVVFCAGTRSDVGYESPCSRAETLMIALNAESPVLSMKSRDPRNFARFRDGVVSRAGWPPEIHIALDNTSAHSTLDVELFLAANPNVRLHFLPSYSAWLDYVEQWLRKIQSAGNSSVGSKSSGVLERKFRRYARAYAKSKTPFCWVSGDISFAQTY